MNVPNGSESHALNIAVAIIVWLALMAACLLRARHSRYPSLLYTCAAYMTLLHGVWIYGLLTSRMMENVFAIVTLLTFPWSLSNGFTLSMVGFGTAADTLLNYARYVLGFGGLECLLLTLFIWEIRPRRAGASR